MTVDVLMPLALLFGLILMRAPIGLALAASGTVGIYLQTDFDVTTNMLATTPYSTVGSFLLSVIPMYILMGLLVSNSGILEGIFSLLARVTARIPGGLGVATVFGTMVFSGVSGSSTADVAAMGKLSIAQLARHGYDRTYSAALVAGAVAGAALIPPSVGYIVYGIVTQESIRSLMLAGILPGVLSGLVFAGFAVGLALRPGAVGTGGRLPAVVDEIDVPPTGGGPSAPPRPLFAAVSGAVLFAVVIGGLYRGVFTATEAGAVGAICALVLVVVFVATEREGHRLARLSRIVGRSFRETASLSGMIFLLVVGASLFTRFLVLSGALESTSSWVLFLHVPPKVIVLLIMLVLIPLGMLVDGLSLMLIVVPLVHPIVTDLGIDGIWLGIILIKTIEVGLLTPPVGLNVFVVSGVVPGLRPEAVFARIIPFIVAEFVIIGILFLWPDLVLVVPQMAGSS